VTLAAGIRLGPYEIVAPLGAGGMGEVYRARDSRLERMVAIKVLPFDRAAAPHAQDRLRFEARAVAALQHPHICTLYDVGETATGQGFIVMELLEGETLHQRLDRGPLEIAAAVDIASMLADGLMAAHAAGIVHRDVTPSNVFLTAHGPKILDFGLAKVSRSTLADALYAATVAITTAGTTVGTIAYMAPEQARGDVVDERSDLFSLGVVLYEMAIGRAPFTRATAALTFDAILNRQPQPPRELNDDVPVALERLICRLLEKHPDARYQSARALLDDLRGLRGAVPARAPSGSIEPSVAVLPFVNLSVNTENQFFCDGLAEELINALTRLPGVRVASRTSAFRFRGVDVDIQQIGRHLNVGAVVEGSVQRSGDRLRVNAQLIDVANGYHLWSDRYDREFSDVFGIQDDIVSAIVNALSPALLGDGRLTVHRPTENLEAFELYLKGRHYWNQRVPGALQHAVRCFEQVIALDPQYALAYAGMADCYAIFRAYGWHSSASTRDRAFKAVSRALALSATLPEVLYSQALYTFYFERCWRDAAAILRRAAAITPRNAHIQAYLAVVLACDNQIRDAVFQAELAAELDPLAPDVHFLRSTAFALIRDFDSAQKAAVRALEIQPDLLPGLAAHTYALCGLGEYERAIAAATRVVALSRAPRFVGELGYLYGVTGRREDALRLLAELDDRHGRGEFITPHAHLLIQLGLGDIVGIRAALEACVQDRTPPLPIKVSCGPALEAFRRDAIVSGLLAALFDDRTPPRSADG
jgi:TolB-like protein